MIRNKTEHTKTQQALAQIQAALDAECTVLAGEGRQPAEIRRRTGAMASVRAGLLHAIHEYDDACRGELPVIASLRDIGRILVAARLSKEWTQRRLAEELEISPAAISKAEREEYQGVTAERAQRILDALGVALQISAKLLTAPAQQLKVPQLGETNCRSPFQWPQLHPFSTTMSLAPDLLVIPTNMCALTTSYTWQCLAQPIPEDVPQEIAPPNMIGPPPGWIDEWQNREDRDRRLAMSGR